MGGLEASWARLGVILGPSWRPKTVQKPSQERQRILLPLFLAPSGASTVPKTTPRCPKSSPGPPRSSPKGSPEAPRRPREGPQDAPRGSPEAPGGSKTDKIGSKSVLKPSCFRKHHFSKKIGPKPPKTLPSIPRLFQASHRKIL